MGRIGQSESTFTWTRYVEGDCTLVDVGGNEYLAVPYGPEGELYNPLAAYTGLFKTFARLGMKRGVLLTSKGIAKNKPGIVAFAAKFGLLGSNKLDAGIRIEQVDGVPQQLEMFDKWVEEISKLSRAVALWEAIRLEDRAFLKKHIRHSVKTKSFTYKSEYAGVSLSEEFYKSIQHEYSPHEYILKELVNTHLVTSSAALLVKNAGQFEVFNMPHSLIGALWQQFAQAIAGNRTYKTCEWCGIEFDATVFRSDRKTCSDSCRVLLSRNKRGGQS